MFYEVLSAINDPNRQASIEQLSLVQTSVQKLAKSQGLEAAQIQLMMTDLGGHLRSVLQPQQPQLGIEDPPTTILSQLTATESTTAPQSLIPPELQQHMVEVMAQKTGVSADTIQSLLPQLLLVVMELLNLGASKSGSSDSDANPLLTAFLGGDRDGSADLGKVMQLAGRFLNGPS